MSAMSVSKDGAHGLQFKPHFGVWLKPHFGVWLKPQYGCNLIYVFWAILRCVKQNKDVQKHNWYKLKVKFAKLRNKIVDLAAQHRTLTKWRPTLLAESSIRHHHKYGGGPKKVNQASFWSLTIETKIIDTRKWTDRRNDYRNTRKWVTHQNDNRVTDLSRTRSPPNQG